MKKIYSTSLLCLAVSLQSCGSKKYSVQENNPQGTAVSDEFILKGETFTFRFDEFKCGEESKGTELPELKGTTLKELQASRSESVLRLQFVPPEAPDALCSYAARYDNDVANERIVRKSSTVTPSIEGVKCSLDFEAMTEKIPFKLAPDRMWASLTVLPKSPSCNGKPANAHFVFDRPGQ